MLVNFFLGVDEGMQNDNVLLFWQVKPVVHVFQVILLSADLILLSMYRSQSQFSLVVKSLLD